MERRRFFQMAAATGMLGAAALSSEAQDASSSQPFIERANPGQPGKGKVFALISPHLDDGPIFAGGTVAKLLNEGYTGYLIRVTNDEKDSYDLSLGETVLVNEQDTARFVKVAGLKKCYDLSYRNHGLDDVSRMEIRVRMVFLFRLLKVDTVITYNPWGHDEENPDHYVTAQAVEAACWMSGDHLDFPEHFEAGLKPHSVSEKYYYARGQHLVNRVVDISATVQQKREYIAACRNMINNMVRSTNEALKHRGLKISAFMGDEDAANRAFIDARMIAAAKKVGEKYGLEYAEEFHYIGPDHFMDEYIRANAQPIS